MKLRISRQLHAAIKARADLLGCSQQSVVRRCLRYAEGVAIAPKAEPATRSGVVVTWEVPVSDAVRMEQAQLRAAVAWALEQTDRPPPQLDIDPADLAQNPVIVDAEKMEG